MSRFLCTALLLLSCAPAFAQDARLVFREAVVGLGPEARWTPALDTTRMERATLDGRPVYLGASLLRLGVGSVASVGLDEDAFTGRPVLLLVLLPEAAEAFAALSTDRVGQPLALVLDGRVLAAPRINGPILGGRIQIDGLESVEETRALARDIALATGARSEADSRRERLLAFRDSVDLSTPQAAAETLLRASELRDLTTLLRAVHPAALSGFADEARGLEFRGDTLVIDVETAQSIGIPERVAASDLLGRALTHDASGEVADVDLVTLMIKLTGPSAFFDAVDDILASFADLDVVAVAQPSDSLAYLVYEMPTLIDEGGSAANVLAFQRVASEWRLLLPLLMMQR